MRHRFPIIIQNLLNGKTALNVLAVGAEILKFNRGAAARFAKDAPCFFYAVWSVGV